MKLVDERTGVEIIEREECLRLLGREVIGRIGFVDRGQPEVLPVNYVLDGEDVVFRTAEGTKLRTLGRAAVVFEVDRVDPADRSGWSVVVHGVAEQITVFDRVELRARAAALPIDPWAPGEKPHLVRIVPRTITGRRVRKGSIGG
jgi:nitroimidazol reductase NimA-like FMN-containing flavoprotein (pyridoxamine 5'-phosphate oxidase superfamily)